jgi:type 1 fimbriae regulatory protein FimB
VISKQRNLPEDLAGDRGARTFLTDAEMKRFLAAARGGRHAVRNYAMMLTAYRHGLRVSELTDLRLKDLDLDAARLYVRRKKGSLSTYHPIEGDELRALRAWLRRRGHRDDAECPYVFLSERGPMTRQAVNYLAVQIGLRAQLEFRVHPQMLRHSTGYHLAYRNCDTKLLQDYLGHRNISHTTKYKRAASGDFEGLWR